MPLTGHAPRQGISPRPGEGGRRRTRVVRASTDGAFGPFPMKASGLLHVDKAGVLVKVTRAEMLRRDPRGRDPGRAAEAPSDPGRSDHPRARDRLREVPGRPRPSRDGNAGAGRPRGHAVVGAWRRRAGLRSGRAEGRRQCGRPFGGLGPASAPDVRGRSPPRSGRRRSSSTGFPSSTQGGLRARLDGSIAIGSWTPDLTLRAESRDLAELERTAENWYAAIQGEPLTPPLRLGGSGADRGALDAGLRRPAIEGSFEASDLLLHGARFGEASAAFTVDRRVATFAPFTAADGAASLAVSGSIGWGGPLESATTGSTIS